MFRSTTVKTVIREKALGTIVAWPSQNFPASRHESLAAFHSTDVADVDVDVDLATAATSLDKNKSGENFSRGQNVVKAKLTSGQKNFFMAVRIKVVDEMWKVYL